MCEEYETLHERTGRPVALMGQLIVLSEIKAEIPLQNEIPSHQNVQLQQYEQRIKLLSQENTVSKFCMDAGFVHVVEVGQYFMTKDSGDFTKFHAVACRAYTLPRDDGSSQPRGWIQGNTRIGLVLEVTTSYMYGKHGIEIRIESVNQDNSHSWVRFSYGTVKYVIDSIQDNTEIPADSQEEESVQTSVKVIAVQHWSDDRWKVCLAAGGGSKRRFQYCTDDSGTIVYLRALQGHSGRSLIDPSLQDNVIIQRGFFQHIYHIGCAFNLHSIINNGLIPGGQNSSKRQTVFFLPIDPRGKGHQNPAHIDFSVPRRAQYLHSVWKKHQDAVFWVDIDLAIQEGLTFYQTRSNAIILQGTLPAYGIPKVVRLKTGEVLNEKSYLSLRPPPKISLRHDHDWTRGDDQVGSTVEHQPVGKLVQQSRGEAQRATFSQLTQPNPKPICDRSGKPDSTEDVFVVKGETKKDEKGLQEELGSSDRSGKPDNLSENTRVEQTHDGSGQLDERNSSSAHTVKEQFAPEENRDIASLNTDNEFNRAINEENIDFNIPGVPHSALKQYMAPTFEI